MTRSRTWVRPVFALAGFALSSAFMIGPTSAAPRSGEVEFSYVNDFSCGAVAFHNEGTTVGRYTDVPHPNSPPHYKEMDKSTETYTNLATGVTVNANWTTREGDERSFVNDDGTLSLIRSRSGMFVITDSHGKVLDRAAGHLSFELVFDTAGTPTDYTDDTFLSFRLIRDHAQTLDICPLLLAVTGRATARQPHYGRNLLLYWKIRQWRTAPGPPPAGLPPRWRSDSARTR